MVLANTIRIHIEYNANEKEFHFLFVFSLYNHLRTQYMDQESIQSRIVREYDQEIPQSQTADNPMAPRGRAFQPSRDT